MWHHSAPPSCIYLTKSVTSKILATCIYLHSCPSHAASQPWLPVYQHSQGQKSARKWKSSYFLLVCFAFNDHLILRKGQNFHSSINSRNSYWVLAWTLQIQQWPNADTISAVRKLTFYCFDLYEIILIFKATVLVLGSERQLLWGLWSGQSLEYQSIISKTKALNSPSASSTKSLLMCIQEMISFLWTQHLPLSLLIPCSVSFLNVVFCYNFKPSKTKQRKKRIIPSILLLISSSDIEMIR